MSFVTGQIVRPKLQYPDASRTDLLRDWTQRVSAQGWISAVLALALRASSQWWDRSTSVFTTTSKTEVGYTVKVWNVETQAFETTTYTESELDLGSVGGVTVSALFADPTTNALAAKFARAVCKERS